MSGLRLGGLASGMDTESIVSQLMAMERQPRFRLERKQAAVQARQDALRDIATKLRALKTAASNLAAPATWTEHQTVTSSDSARVGVRTTGAVPAGTYDVEVQQLAATASRTLTTQLRPNASTLTFTVTASGTQYAVNIPANSSVDDIVALINADSAAPIAASNYNGQLQVTAKASGGAGNFTVTGQVVTGETSSTLGADAQFTVNGVVYTRTSNTVTDVVPGAELTLSGLTLSPVTITASAASVDTKGLAARAKAFVDAYNAVVDATRSRTTEKRVANATTLMDARKGVLFGDGALGNMLSQLRLAVMEPVAVGNVAGMDELAEIGISTGAPTGGTSTAESVNGRLVFDEEKFLAAYASDPDGLERLLRGTASETGFAGRLDGVLKPLVETGGLLDGRITAAGSELTRLADGLRRMDERLGRKEVYLRRQFTALEGALSKLNAQGAELAARLPRIDNS